MKINRGDVYLAQLDPVIGSEQGGIRPVVIIQNDIGNQYSTTVVAAITGKSKKTYLPTHVKSSANDPFLRQSAVIMCEQLRTLDKSRLVKYMGTLDKETAQQMDAAILHSVGVAPSKGGAW